MGRENFSPCEQWAWEQIENGKPANLSECPRLKDIKVYWKLDQLPPHYYILSPYYYSKKWFTFDPKYPYGWENRILSKEFRAELRKHLAEQVTQSARRKVCIIGACVRGGEAIGDIGNFTFLHEFSLEKCRIEVDVCLAHVHSHYGISLHGSYMKKLDLS